MKLKTIIAAIGFLGICGWHAGAQIYDTNNVVVQTFAGSGFSGYMDGQGTQTMFNAPMTIVADTSSNLFVLDYANPVRIRKITPDGTVTTFAGGGLNALPGYGTNVMLPFALAMTIDHSNTLYLMSYATGTSMVRIGADGYASNIPLPGLVGGQVRDGLCVDSGNNVYISDTGGNKIWRYRTNGILEVFAGSGNQGSVDGNGVFTSFSSPTALAADSADNIYVVDANKLIRKINQNRDVVTIAGNQSGTDSDGAGMNASFYLISGMCADGFGNLYLACFSATGGESIRKMTAATNVTTLAGSFTQGGYVNGSGTIARLRVAVTKEFVFRVGCYLPAMRSITVSVKSVSIQRRKLSPVQISASALLPASLSLALSAGRVRFNLHRITATGQRRQRYY